MSGEPWVSGNGISDDGVVVGYSGSNGDAVMWINGVPTKLTPSFAPMFPGAPLIKGSRIAGSGLDTSWNSHAWTLAVPSVSPPVDCVVASLGFSECSASCGGGTQTEILEVVTAPANGGAACRDPLVQACNTHSCDSDGDGVPDTGDQCPATPAGAKVDSSGCSGAQIVARACPTSASYKNHGAYVSCVAKASWAAVLSGLLTDAEKSAITSAAARSDVGKK